MAVRLDKPPNRAVICALSLGREEACGELAGIPVVGDALAAFSLSAAGRGVRARAVQRVLGLCAFHDVVIYREGAI